MGTSVALERVSITLTRISPGGKYLIDITHNHELPDELSNHILQI